MKGAKIIKKEPFISENTSGGLLKFKRSQLCIPYGLFLSVFVIFPLFLIIYYAFTSKTGEFSFDNFTAFFVETTNISTLIISIFVSFVVTVLCLLISSSIDLMSHGFTDTATFLSTKYFCIKSPTIVGAQ